MYGPPLARTESRPVESRLETRVEKRPSVSNTRATVIVSTVLVTVVGVLIESDDSGSSHATKTNEMTRRATHASIRLRRCVKVILAISECGTSRMTVNAKPKTERAPAPPVYRISLVEIDTSTVPPTEWFTQWQTGVRGGPPTNTPCEPPYALSPPAAWPRGYRRGAYVPESRRAPPTEGSMYGPAEDRSGPPRLRIGRTVPLFTPTSLCRTIFGLSPTVNSPPTRVSIRNIRVKRHSGVDKVDCLWPHLRNLLVDRTISYVVMSFGLILPLGGWMPPEQVLEAPRNVPVRDVLPVQRISDLWSSFGSKQRGLRMALSNDRF